MAQLFSGWSNTALRLALAGVVCGGAAAIAAPLVFMRTPFNTGQHYPVDQPVPFDHRHHVQDDGIECRYCHNTVERSASAGVPATELCMGCHSQVWRDSPMLEPVRRSYYSGQPIPWNRVHALPGFVYFDHSIHVNHGIDCASCHGRVDQMANVEQASPLNMAWCLDCHRAREHAGRSGGRKLDDCYTCHR